MKSYIIDHSTTSLHTAENTSLYFDEMSGFIYVAYIGEGFLPFIARCQVGEISDEQSWEIVQIDDQSVSNDSHNGISLGIDPTGNLHVIWNTHNGLSFSRYKKTSTPHDLMTLEWADNSSNIISIIPNANISYSRFYRSGESFYLTFRNGIPGNADQYLLIWDQVESKWAYAGMSDNGLIIYGNNSSPYLGVCRGSDDGSGSLLIPFVRRELYYNTSLHLRTYDMVGSQIILDPIQVGQSLANTGISVVEMNGSICVSYIMVSESGYPEIFMSRLDMSDMQPGEWKTYQATDCRLPRLRGCVNEPFDGPYRPCDFELQGPWVGIAESSVIRLIYGRSVSLPGNAWQRPVTILYDCLSYDLGETWEVAELSLPVVELTTELTINNNSQHLDFVLCQDLKGYMRLLDFRDDGVAKKEVDISFDSDRISHLLAPLSDTPFYSQDPFEIGLTIRPDDTPSPMGLIDCGGLVGSRFFRVLLWGKDRPLIYSPNHLQILIGNGDNWTHFWFPEVTIEPGTYTHLKITRIDGVIILYKLSSQVWSVIDALEIGEITLPALFNRSLLIGGVESGTKAILYPYSGKLEVRIR
jgi:BNR repeat-containing family member